MNWDEIEQQLTEHIHSKENDGYSVPDDLKNKVWAKVHIAENKHRMKFVWIAAASVILFFLSGMALYIKYEKMKAQNVTLAVEVQKLQESNKALKFQLKQAPIAEVAEKTKLIVKTKIVYKTIEKQAEATVSKSVDNSKEIKPSEFLVSQEESINVQTIHNDSATPVKKIIAEAVENKNNIGTEVDSINNNLEFKPLISETAKPKWFRLKIGFGNYMSESQQSAWKLSFYSR